MYWQHWNGAAWSGWISLGGIFTSVPSAVSRSAGRIDVFGIGTDGAMYHKYHNGAWSTSWEDLGGIFISAPTVVSVSYPPSLKLFGHKNSKLILQWGANRLDIFGVGTDKTAQLGLSPGMAMPGLRDGIDWDEVLTLSKFRSVGERGTDLHGLVKHYRKTVSICKISRFSRENSRTSSQKYYMIDTITCFFPLCKTNFTIPHQLKQTSLFRADGRSYYSVKLPVSQFNLFFLHPDSSELKHLKLY